jgi:RNA polymerase sigma factor (sigma-70 family)
VTIDSEALYTACRQDGSAPQVDAFEQLSAYLYRIAAAMLRDRPGGPELAADCTQVALVKVYQNLDRCQEPAAFRGWAASILRRTVIDAIRQSRSLEALPLPEDDHHLAAIAVDPPADPDELGPFLRRAIAAAPLSDRSRRVVAGRFFEERGDDELARAETALSGQQVLPSHIQVTRAKNLAKLRSDAALLATLRQIQGEE